MKLKTVEPSLRTCLDRRSLLASKVGKVRSQKILWITIRTMLEQEIKIRMGESMGVRFTCTT
jgi:hypothetical protein